MSWQPRWSMTGAWENRSTAHGVVISPHEKYISELVKLHGMEHRKPEQTPDIGYDSLDGPGLFDMDKHLFRSSMGTLLYLSQDRVDIQHAARNLSQWMSRPTKLALYGVKHVFLYLSWTSSYGLLLPYQVPSTSKLEEIHCKENSTCANEKVSDTDWAGDKSNMLRRRHSVSSGMVFVNGRLVTAWSRTQKSALSSCESEYLASASAKAEALYMGRLWTFLTQRETEISVWSLIPLLEGPSLNVVELDASSIWMWNSFGCRKLFEMDWWPSNPWQMWTKKLSRQRRLFLMFLMGMVHFNKDIMEYEAVGGQEFTEQRKSTGKNMKVVRPVMMQTIRWDPAKDLYAPCESNDPFGIAACCKGHEAWGDWA